MYCLLSHQHQYLEGCCTLQHLLCFGLFLMLRSSSTLFSIISPFTERGAVLSISNLTVDGKKKHCLHFYFFPTVCCQKNWNGRLPSYEPLCMNRDVMQLGKEMFLNHPPLNLYIPSSQAQLQAILKTEQEGKKTLFLLLYSLKRAVSVGRSRCYHQWGGRRGWKHSLQEKQPQTLWTPHSRLSHRVLFPSSLMLCNMSLNARHRNISSLHFSSQRECPWEGVVPLGQ